MLGAQNALKKFQKGSKKAKKWHKMAKNDIFREVFFCWSVRHEITFNLICHMLHIWKSTKLAFSHLKNAKKANNEIFRAEFFYWSVSHEIAFNLICHMIHIWKSSKLVIFCIKKTQKWHKMAKNDVLTKCEKKIPMTRLS